MALIGNVKKETKEGHKVEDKNYKRITVRIYKPEIIQVIETVPKGFRSAMVQSALASYIEAGKHTAFQAALSKTRTVSDRQAIRATLKKAETSCS